MGDDGPCFRFWFYQKDWEIFQTLLIEIFGENNGIWTSLDGETGYCPVYSYEEFWDSIYELKDNEKCPSFICEYCNEDYQEYEGMYVFWRKDDKEVFAYEQETTKVAFGFRHHVFDQENLTEREPDITGYWKTYSLQNWAFRLARPILRDSFDGSISEERVQEVFERTYLFADDKERHENLKFNDIVGKVRGLPGKEERPAGNWNREWNENFHLLLLECLISFEFFQGPEKKELFSYMMESFREKGLFGPMQILGDCYSNSEV